MVTYTRYPTLAEVATGAETVPDEVATGVETVPDEVATGDETVPDEDVVRVAKAEAAKRRDPPYRPSGVVTYDVCGVGNGQSVADVPVATEALDALGVEADADVAAPDVKSSAPVDAVGKLGAETTGDASGKLAAEATEGVANELDVEPTGDAPEGVANELADEPTGDAPEGVPNELAVEASEGVPNELDVKAVEPTEGVANELAVEPAEGVANELDVNAVEPTEDDVPPQVKAFDAAVCKLFQPSRAVSPTLRNESAVC